MNAAICLSIRVGVADSGPQGLGKQVDTQGEGDNFRDHHPLLYQRIRKSAGSDGVIVMAELAPEQEWNQPHQSMSEIGMFQQPTAAIAVSFSTSIPSCIS